MASRVALVRGFAGSLLALLCNGIAAQAPPQQPPVASPPGIAATNPYLQAMRLPVRVVAFSVEPATIKPGEPVTLRWQVENPTSIAIGPEIGIVLPYGTRRVTPTATTTFTITAVGTNGTITQSATVTVPGTRPVAAAAIDPAAILRGPTPRMSDGRPDLSGVYNIFSLGGGGTAPPAGRGRGAGPTLKPGAERFRVTREGNDVGRNASCLPVGVPGAWNLAYPFQLIQTSKQLIILYEYLNMIRFIPLDGRPQPEDPDESWMGRSVGRWEGDTLVIDTVGFNERTEFGGFRTPGLHVVERLRRPSFGTLAVQATVDDPNIFAAPISQPARTFPLRPELERIDEFFCENNRDYRVLFGQAQ
jgi:hypothetical protein